VALFHGSSAVIGVRLNKNPAELAAAKIVPPPKMFKNYVYSLIESLLLRFRTIMIRNRTKSKFIYLNEKRAPVLALCSQKF